MEKKKIIVTGCNGQLGRAISRELAGDDRYELTGCDVTADVKLDITDTDEVMRFAEEISPEAIINCAAYTAVDRQETDSDLSMKINAIGPRNLAIAASRTGAKLMHISTDYVFSGEGEEPWTEEDPYQPKNVYGLSKLQGEIAVRSLMKRYFLLRTSWVFGLHGRNFVRTMRQLGRERNEIRVVDDQVGSPTYTVDLARVICNMIPTEKYGIYHVCNSGWMSWAHFAELIMAEEMLRCKVTPVPTSEYPTPAHRPLNSRMSTRKLNEAGFGPMPGVEDALHRYLQELAAEQREG